MSKTITVGLSNESFEAAAKALRQYADWVKGKETELRRRLAERGAEVARIRFSGANYDGKNDVTVRVDNTGNVAVIYAEGKAVAFIEFGSGAAYGYGHPQASEFGVGPGTYSDNEDLGGKHHWAEPDGWYYAHGKRSLGNLPAMAMYDAVQAIAESVLEVAREVFST